MIATNGFEDSELMEPRKRLLDQGAEVTLASLDTDEIEGDKGEARIKPDLAIDDVRAQDYDALLLPGGVLNPDKLRIAPDAVRFVKAFVDSGKPIAAICHGPWTLIEAEGVRGRKMTSYPSLRSDLKNAGANWVDQEVVVDRGLVTSRKPDDIPAFNRKMIEEFAEGVHAGAGSGARRTTV